MMNIDSLPDEILGMLFVISLSGQRSVLSPFKPSSSRSYVTAHLGYHNRTDAPFVFLQVSSRWRRVAKSVRSLWANLSACQYGYVASTGVPLAAFRWWLSLSGNLPLHLFVDIPRNYKTRQRRRDGPTARHSQKLMAIFAEDRHLNRWKSISVVLTPALCAQLAETLIHKYSTLHSPVGLERIEIVLLDQVSPTRLLYAIGRVTSLREIFWRSERPTPFQTFIELLPLGRLTRVFLHTPISVFEAAIFLAKCKTVTHVTLQGIYTPSESNPLSIETLPKLAELALCGTQNILAILDSIQCPVLKILDINNPSHRPYPRSWKSLHSFFKRSQSEVNGVVIQHSAKLPAVDLAGYLRIGQEFGVPYYMATSRDAHATARAVLRPGDGLERFKRYVRIPGGREYVGMDRLVQCARYFDNICLREVSTLPLKCETVLCVGVKARLSTYLVNTSYTPASSALLHFPF